MGKQYATRPLGQWSARISRNWEGRTKNRTHGDKIKQQGVQGSFKGKKIANPSRNPGACMTKLELYKPDEIVRAEQEATYQLARYKDLLRAEGVPEHQIDGELRFMRKHKIANIIREMRAGTFKPQKQIEAEAAAVAAEAKKIKYACFQL